MTIHYTQVRKGWLVQGVNGDTAEIDDDHGGLVHRIINAKGVRPKKLEYAFNWSHAKRQEKDAWERVHRPEFIQPYTKY